MSEENTKWSKSFEECVWSRFDALDRRIDALEQRITLQEAYNLEEKAALEKLLIKLNDINDRLPNIR